MKWWRWYAGLRCLYTRTHMQTGLCFHLACITGRGCDMYKVFLIEGERLSLRSSTIQAPFAAFDVRSWNPLTHFTHSFLCSCTNQTSWYANLPGACPTLVAQHIDITTDKHHDCCKIDTFDLQYAKPKLENPTNNECSLPASTEYILYLLDWPGNLRSLQSHCLSHDLSSLLVYCQLSSMWAISVRSYQALSLL